MVSQANYFKDDISGELFDTPIKAIESERGNKIMEDLRRRIEDDASKQRTQ